MNLLTLKFHKQSYRFLCLDCSVIATLKHIFFFKKKRMNCPQRKFFINRAQMETSTNWNIKRKYLLLHYFSDVFSTLFREKISHFKWLNLIVQVIVLDTFCKWNNEINKVHVSQCFKHLMKREMPAEEGEGTAELWKRGHLSLDAKQGKEERFLWRWVYSVLQRNQNQ